MDSLYPKLHMSALSRHSVSYKTLLLCLLFSLLVLISLPIFKAGYFSDDIINSLIPGTIKIYHFNFWTYVYEYMKIWINYGRFFPLSILSSIAIFNYFPTIHDYQIIRLVFIWISVCSFAWWLKTLTRDNVSALLFLILIPMCWSIHDVTDPLVSFAIFLPLVVIFMAMTLTFLHYYFDTRKNSWLALSLIMYLFGLACYELGTVTFFLMLLMVMMRADTLQDKMQTIKPYAIITLTYLATYLIIQHTNVATYDGIKIELSMHFWAGFIAQLTSALPLSYFFLASHTHLHFFTLLQNSMINTPLPVATIYVFFATGMLSLWLLSQVRMQPKNIFFIGLSGCILLIYPALLIGINQKYQLIVEAGRAYIPVYVQYFGMASILFAGIAWLNLYFGQKKWLHCLIAMIISSTIVFSWIVNLAVVADNNEQHYNTRALLEKALQHKVLALLPNKAYLVEQLALWNIADFYAINSEKNLAGVIDINDRKNLLSGNNYQQAFYIEAYHLNKTQNGFVTLGHIQAFRTKKMAPAVAITTKIQIEKPIVFITAANLAEYKKISAALSLRWGLSSEEQAKLLAMYSQSKNHWVIAALTKNNVELTMHDN